MKIVSALSNRSAFAAGCLGLVAACSSPASANNFQVRLACANDYYALCSKHDPDSPAVRACMRANGLKLSQRCVNALVSAGQMSPSDLARLASARR